jgi:hypothetical protein
MSLCLGQEDEQSLLLFFAFFLAGFDAAAVTGFAFGGMVALSSSSLSFLAAAMSLASWSALSSSSPSKITREGNVRDTINNQH